LNHQNIVLAVCKSILNRSCEAKVGNLLLRYGGGGHDAAGTCQIAAESADQVLSELVEIFGFAKVPATV
jgi:nanoRNase/pAp phosphatase (c-di-AMP/oligoRNAs hydrolase)